MSEGKKFLKTKTELPYVFLVKLDIVRDEKVLFYEWKFKIYFYENLLSKDFLPK